MRVERFLDGILGRTEEALEFKYHVSHVENEAAVQLSCPGCGQPVGRFSINFVVDLARKGKLHELKDHLVRCV